MRFLLIVLFLIFCQSANSQEIPVFIYHKVNDAEPPTETNIHRKTLETHFDKILSLGYTTVTISQLEQHLKGEIVLPEKSIAITFDDGWKTDLIAAELLEKRKMKATFYFLSGAFQNPVYLNKEDMKKISSVYLFEIGAHTHTHFMEWEGRMDKADERVLYGEAIMSKILLEKIIGKNIKTFSWPFGYYRENINNSLTSLGYTSVVHVNAESKNTRNTSPLWIQRLNIDGRCTAKHIEEMLNTKKFKECR